MVLWSVFLKYSEFEIEQLISSRFSLSKMLYYAKIVLKGYVRNMDGWMAHHGNEVLEVICMPWTQLTRIELISINYQSHRASQHSAAGKEVVRT